MAIPSVSHCGGLGDNNVGSVELGLQTRIQLWEIGVISFFCSACPDTGFSRAPSAGRKHLQGLNKLRTVYLKETHVTAADVAALQAALPECPIVP